MTIKNNKWIKNLNWNNAIPLNQMNIYKGMVDNSCYHLQPYAGLNIVVWESKFDIDADGSGPKVPGDTYLPDTSLHDRYNRPLNSWELPFGVIPLNSKMNYSITETGLGLGDLGVAFYKDQACPFIFGDRGPRDKIGEGSAYMAYNLGINYDPVRGGLQNVPPGVIFVNFIGTRDRNDKRTDRDLMNVWNNAWLLYVNAINPMIRSRDLNTLDRQIMMPMPRQLDYSNYICE